MFNPTNRWAYQGVSFSSQGRHSKAFKRLISTLAGAITTLSTERCLVFHPNDLNLCTMMVIEELCLALSSKLGDDEKHDWHVS